MVKKGFSLAEALVVMAVISIFFAVAGKVMTQRQKPQVLKNQHGYFECYLNGGTLMQARATEGIVSEPVAASGGVCTFEPPKGIAFFNLNTFGRAYYSAFEPNVNNVIDIRINDSAYTTDFVTISKGSDSLAIPAATNTTGATFLNEKAVAETYLEIVHPSSQIYNKGNYRTGVMFSW